MPYPDTLNAIIDERESDARGHFVRPNQRIRLEGALDGLSACRGLGPENIAALLDEALRRREQASRGREGAYWFWRERELQIEHVLGVLSAILAANGLPGFGDVYLSHARRAADILS